MASYTMQLREFIEQATQDNSNLKRAEVIEQGRLKLFDFDYPIFDPAYKKVFETNFIRHFYMREIGAETEGLFKFNLETWLLIHMPYFNKMYESSLMEFDPFINSKVDVTHTKKSDIIKNDERDVISNDTSNGSSTTDGTSSSDSTTSGVVDNVGKTTVDEFERKLESNNPDSRLALTANDGEGVIEYASGIKEENENSVTDNTNKETSTGTTSVDGTTSQDVSQTTTSDSVANDKFNSTVNDLEDFVQHRVGKIGIQTYSKMLLEYRGTFMRIEKQMFREMQDLFMLVY